MLRRGIALALSWAIAAGPVALETRAAQQQGANGAQSKNDPYGQQVLAGFEKRAPSHDLVAENLARVAATADQIIGVLTRDSGLMVEMKTLYAKEAGLQGQLLEESDLTDSAITERLRQDLRLRMLATKLVQRYGYLLPRLNPDSDMAEERVLYLRQKAAEMQRTAALGGAGVPGAGCDPRADLSCLALQAAASGALQQNAAPTMTPAPQTKPAQPQAPLPDYSSMPEVRAGNSQQNSVETLLASAKLGENGDGGGTNPLSAPSTASRTTLASGLGSPLPPQASQSNAVAALAVSSVNSPPA